MAKRIKALVEPSLLVWARETASLLIEDAAKAIGVPAEELGAWERGEGGPSIPQLKKLANAYKRPLPVFYLPEPPTEFQPLKDFRRLPDTHGQPLGARLAFEIRAAQERRSIALDIWASLGETPPQLRVTARRTDNPEDVAAQLRERLGITLEHQSRWGEPDKAFKAWREAIENAGVLVFALGGAHHKVPIQEVRGFAIAEQPLPAIVVNGRDRTNGRIFTLLHELGHVVLGTSAIENELEPNSSLPPPERAIETFCNRLAAAVLMPRSALLAEVLVAKRQPHAPWTDAEVSALARRYCVSREALLVRLVELGKADPAFYEAKRAEYALQYEELEREREQEPGNGFALPQYQILSHLGRGYARLVLQGYYQNRLTLSTVSGYLGAQAKLVRKIERAAFSGAA